MEEELLLLQALEIAEWVYGYIYNDLVIKTLLVNSFKDSTPNGLSCIDQLLFWKNWSIRKHHTVHFRCI
jgi:hypothetical protein